MSEPKALLPTDQHAYPDLPKLSLSEIHDRRQKIFILLSGLFLGTLAMLNILGISRFIKLFEIDFDPSTPGTTVTFAVAVGVLPYPRDLPLHRLHLRVLRPKTGEPGGRRRAGC
jgi:hypothetical protein